MDGYHCSGYDSTGRSTKTQNVDDAVFYPEVDYFLKQTKYEFTILQTIRAPQIYKNFK